MESIWIIPIECTLALACQFHGKRVNSYNFCRGLFAITVDIPLMHEIPGQNKVIPGSLDTPSKSVKSLDCPGHPWTVGNYVPLPSFLPPLPLNSPLVQQFSKILQLQK